MSDIAASLFTTQYRNEHIAGKIDFIRKTLGKGKGSCFDLTAADDNRAGIHPVVKPNETETPEWSRATMQFRYKTDKPIAANYLKKGKTTKAKRNKPRPPKSDAFRRRENPPNTTFRCFYDRGDLPICVDHKGVKNGLMWKVDLNKIDYHHYLPVFFDGVRETQEPYRFLAVKGCEDMLRVGGAKIRPVIPQLIIPIKTALNTRDEQVICIMLRLLQKLVVSGDMIGESLVPYYRQILPIFNLYKNRNRNLGGSMDYSQQSYECLGDLIAETLTLFEQQGGEDAFINIKYLVPTYESCINYA